MAPGAARKWALTGVAVLVVAATIGTLVFSRTQASGAPDSAPEAAATDKIVRTDLSDSQQFSGTLGYGEQVALTGHKAGTVTWLPGSGAEVRRGGTLYRVDNEPVVLFLGSLPLYRNLAVVAGREPLTGPDVDLVIRNLRALGYPVEGHEYDDATAAAVRKWQQHVGLPATGAIGPGDVVVRPGEVRIDAVQAQLGDPGEGQLMVTTGTRQAVTLSIDVTQTALLTRGTKVAITLPNGKQSSGTVREVSRDAAADSEGVDPTQSAPAKVLVFVTLDHAKAAGDLESAPVQVSVATETRRDVLAVPVGALLALREGGYGVQVVEGGHETLLPVETGLFSLGMVEISGSGIAEGQTVVVTS